MVLYLFVVRDMLYFLVRFLVVFKFLIVDKIVIKLILLIFCKIGKIFLIIIFVFKIVNFIC